MTSRPARLSRTLFLRANRLGYDGLVRPLIFRRSAQEGHLHMQRWLRRLDAKSVQPLLGAAHDLAFTTHPVAVGGVGLDSPLILAAGLVKGEGFTTEEVARRAVQRGRNIMPGWRGIPRLVGPVEFGSFTRWPRLGNPGTVVWRDVTTRSSQNRIGLRNPGALAAAGFLAARAPELPAQFGINIAVSPGVDDPAAQAEEVGASFRAFLDRGVVPTWFTLNLSCPNTEDDPGNHQTAAQARIVCGAALEMIRAGGHTVPLWVKLGPNLAHEQYGALLRVFAETGVRAVVATNTLSMPSPNDPDVMAGVGGGQLHAQAVVIAALLMAQTAAHGYDLDVVGCGGVLDGATYRDFVTLGVSAAQYWTALIYRGLLAAALILDEAE
jgi:dihydroorotate dehydrogenase